MAIKCKCGQNFGSLTAWRDHWLDKRPAAFEQNSRKGVSKWASDESKRLQLEYDLQHVRIEPPKPSPVTIKTGRRNADNRTVNSERIVAARISADALLDMNPSAAKQAVQMLKNGKSIREIASTLNTFESEVIRMLRNVAKQASNAAPDLLGAAIERDLYKDKKDYPT